MSPSIMEEDVRPVASMIETDKLVSTAKKINELRENNE